MIKKLPKNPAERQFVEEMAALGWNLYKKGWPDFLGIKGNDVVFVEVKRRRSERLKREQMVVLRILASLGGRCYRWSPSSGLEPIGPLQLSSTLANALAVEVTYLTKKPRSLRRRVRLPERCTLPSG